MYYPLLLFFSFSFLSSSIASENLMVEYLLDGYQQQGAYNFDRNRGEALWFQSFRNAKTGKLRACTSCHFDDLKKPGKHVRTGKQIEPLAPSVNAERFADIKKVKKWLRRNCKWTLGRECTPQEKGDLLRYLQYQ